MSNFERKIKRQREIDELLNIKKLYGKKPKFICPRCHKKTLFMTNNKNEIYCIRCDQLVSKKQ